jgi:hypothetical protein
LKPVLPCLSGSKNIFFSDGDSSITTENNDDSNQASIISAITFDLAMGTSQPCNNFSAEFNTVDTIAKSHLLQVATNGEGASRQMDQNQSLEMYLQQLGDHGKPSFKALKLLLSTLELRCHCHGDSHPSVTREWNLQLPVRGTTLGASFSVPPKQPERWRHFTKLSTVHPVARRL